MASRWSMLDPVRSTRHRRRYARRSRAQKAKLDAAIPLGRVAEPVEIANLVTVAGVGRGELWNSDYLFRRRRHHAVERRPVLSARSETMQRIVVLGGGFGGIEVAAAIRSPVSP